VKDELVIRLTRDDASRIGGQGSSTWSCRAGSLKPRNHDVRRILEEVGFATLLMDLLTEAVEVIDLRTRQLRSDIGLLAGRLIRATDLIVA
jgi:hypothetical protein